MFGPRNKYMSLGKDFLNRGRQNAPNERKYISFQVIEYLLKEIIRIYIPNVYI